MDVRWVIIAVNCISHWRRTYRTCGTAKKLRGTKLLNEVDLVNEVNLTKWTKNECDVRDREQTGKKRETIRIALNVSALAEDRDLARAHSASWCSEALEVLLNVRRLDSAHHCSPCFAMKSGPWDVRRHFNGNDIADCQMSGWAFDQAGFAKKKNSVWRHLSRFS